LLRAHSAAPRTPSLLAEPFDIQSHRYTSVIWNMVPGDWMIPDGWDDRCIDDLNRLDGSERAVVVLHDIPNACLAGLDRFLTRIEDGVKNRAAISRQRRHHAKRTVRHLAGSVRRGCSPDPRPGTAVMKNQITLAFKVGRNPRRPNGPRT